jgi:hypothetical protein
MSFQDTIRILLGRGAKGLGELDAVEWKRVAARTAWVRETVAAWREAQDRADDAWSRLVEDLPDDFPEDEELPGPPEQAEADALYAQIRAVIDHDRWPPHLYFGEI